MSATESSAVTEVKATETPAVVDAVVDAKAEEPAAVVEAAVENEAATVEPTVTEDATTSESKAEGESKKDGSKGSPSFLSKLFSGLKGEKKPKAPKSPKKEKKKEEVEDTAEAPKDAEVSAAEIPAEAVETVKEAESIVAETATPEVPAVVAEEVKEITTVAPKAEAKALKVGRRLSARVGDFFKNKSKNEVTTPAKVDEYPPKIDEPEAIAPLENPASEAAKAEELKATEVVAPVVAAAA